MPEPQNLRASGERIEQALTELQASRGPSFAQPGRGAAAPGLGPLRRRAGPDGRDRPGAGARAGRRLRRRRAGRQPLAGAGPAPRPARRPGGGRAGVRPALPRPARRRRGAAGGRRRPGGRQAAAPGQLRRVSVLGRDVAGRRRGRHLGGGARGDPDRRRGAERGRRRRPCPIALGVEAAATTRARPRWRCDDRPDRGAAAHPRQQHLPVRLLRSRRCASCARSRSRASTDTSWTCAPGHCSAPAAGASSSSSREGAGGDHFRSVPERYVAFGDFELSPAQWDSLQIPVSVAFFFLNSELERIAAFYPGPAGATESELPLDTWTDLVAANPQLATMQPDVEAFLVRAASDRERARRRVLHRADRRLLRAGRPPPDAVARLRRRQRGQPEARRLLRRHRERAAQ